MRNSCVLCGNRTPSENFPQHGNKDHRSFTAANQHPVVFGGSRSLQLPFVWSPFPLVFG
jgi:hypothetical protein